MSGNLENFNSWYIDDILLFQPTNLDLKVNRINIDSFIVKEIQCDC